MHEIIFKIGYFETGLSKSLKKFNFQTFIFFFSNLAPFNEQGYEKAKVA